MALVFSVLLAIALDFLFKEPKHIHPLIGFGKWASWLETHLNQQSSNRWKGVLAWVLAVVPFVVLFSATAFYLADERAASVIFGGFLLYLAIGWQSLLSHALAVAQPLAQGDIEAARNAVSMIVSRDTSSLPAPDIASAATESVLENGADAIFAALFWFVVLGVPGVVLYRLSNTLDAMWGYKNDRYLKFGWAAARADDVLNYVPARLTALTYALAGCFRASISAWKKIVGNWKSPNAGPVMAAGAGAIKTRLGGGSFYHGIWQERPILGHEDADQPSAESIEKACKLVNRGLMIWIVAILALGLATI